MVYQQPRHAAPDPDAGTRASRTPGFWLAPIVISLAVLSALAAFYLGGILNPLTNLRHFPIAVVNADTGPVGTQITDGLVSGLDKNRFDIRVLSAADAQHQLDTAQVYGQVVIPANFSETLQALGQSALQPGLAARPAITVSTNPRAGTLGASIASQTMSQALAKANTAVGQRVTAQAAQQSGGAPLPGAVALVLANPIDVQTNVYAPLPNGTGNGLSAFYYSLLLLLAGFTGSLVISPIVDSSLGYAPAEFGPVYRFADQTTISRFRTLLIKWALMLGLALAISAVYLGIANALGMPIPKPWPLWLYSVFTILAVGVTSMSMIAILGALGPVVNLLVFVILGLPSAGATVPLQATPAVFRWLAGFEPMHQVFLGARALLYLDGHADAGLSRALTMTAIGLVVGLVLGAVVTMIYDRKGFHRIAAPVAPTAGKTEAADVDSMTG
jgi:YhgE/Pip-like protein